MKPGFIICPECKGNGFTRIPYTQAKEEVHVQCTECNSQGEIKVGDRLTPEKLREKGML